MKFVISILILALALISCDSNRPSALVEVTSTTNIPQAPPTLPVQLQTSPTPRPQLLIGLSQIDQVLNIEPDKDSPQIGGAIIKKNYFFILGYIYIDSSELWLLVPTNVNNTFGWTNVKVGLINLSMVKVSNETYNNVYQLAALAKDKYKINPYNEQITWLPQTTPEPPSQVEQQDLSIISCKDTDDKIGQFVTCKVDRAYCEFLPNVNGDPTFCNDASYPNNNFTLVVFGQDWSDLDGKCIIVSGTISTYRGKPQIETKNRARVSYCP